LEEPRASAAWGFRKGCSFFPRKCSAAQWLKRSMSLQLDCGGRWFDDYGPECPFQAARWL
jgi:hypothetical protein